MHVLELNDSRFKLPSGGSSCGLEDGQIKIRSWIIDHERQFASVLGCGDAYRIYKVLMEALIVEPKNLNFDNLLLSDVLTVLYAVKEKSFGPIMEIEYPCPSCRVRNGYEIVIPDLLVKYPEDIEDYGISDLELKLQSAKVTCHLPTLGDQKAVAQFIKHLEKSGRLKNKDKDEEIAYMAQVIDSIDDKPRMMIQEKFERILQFHPDDKGEFARFIEDQDTGLILDQSSTSCLSCSRNIDLPLSVGPDFFRSAPSKRRKLTRTYM